MLVDAALFAGIVRRQSITAQSILLCCHRLKMRGVHTVTMHAPSCSDVIELCTLGDRPDEQLVGKAMSEHKRALDRKLPVAVAVERRCPQPAGARVALIDLPPEALDRTAAALSPRMSGVRACFPLAQVVLVAESAGLRWQSTRSN